MDNYNYNLSPDNYSVTPRQDWPLKKWYQKRWGVAVIIMVALMALLAVLVFYFWWQAMNFRPPAGETDNLAALEQQLADGLAIKNQKRQLAEKTDRPSFGNQNAQLVIVEFSDFQCPFCGQEFPIIREVISNHQNELFYIYRNFISIDNFSINLSSASLCANEQNKFWPMHDKLFLNQGKVLSDSDIRGVAQQIGVDLKQFDDCYKQEKYKNLVIEDHLDGINLGVKGTPTFFVNGNKLEGVVTQERWEEIIRKALELLK